MRLTFAVFAAIMTASPASAQDEPNIKYHIKYIDSSEETYNDLTNFNMQKNDKAVKYKNESYDTPKFFIKDKETNNFFKKAN